MQNSKMMTEDQNKICDQISGAIVRALKNTSNQQNKENKMEDKNQDIENRFTYHKPTVFQFGLRRAFFWD